MTTPPFVHPAPAAEYSIGFVFSQEPTEAAITEVFADFEPTVEHNEWTFDALDARVTFSTTAQAYPDPSPMERTHPIFQDEPVDLRHHTAHGQLTVTPEADERPSLTHYIGSYLAAVVAGLPETTAIIDLTNNCHWAPGTYQNIIDQDRETTTSARLWAPVWVLPGDGPQQVCTTLGLRNLGHAEVQVTNAQHHIREAFDTLMTLSDFVCRGGVLEPGENLALDDERTINLTAEPSFVAPHHQAITVTL